ncbi:DUF1178 family protein [Sphingobium sufflavum]|uniref:DUF1178 family protein n=1 Tax=Sphingobium sufflavum TaxID=1129547 RepID=UPI001F269599|nr:DUF1178 family protein [Sphingobium sufflavum]MCE7797269.1 DUF1178 family protein [Sphingobium sufflavum]
MIVFDLKCSHGHVFEAWFGSSRDYEAQQGRGLVSCPICHDPRVEKAVMAPAVAAKSNQRDGDSQRAGGHQRDERVDPSPNAMVPVAAQSSAQPQAGRAVAAMGAEEAAKLQAVIETLAQVQAQLLEKSAWVGDAFADKARAMHYGETPKGNIHGTTNVEEARALLEEGIAVAPLPIPVVPPTDRN